MPKGFGYKHLIIPAPPPPTVTTDTDVASIGIKLYVPAVVYNCDPGVTAGVTLLLVALLALVPTEFVAVTMNVYCVPAVNPVTAIVPEPA
jgi:hypothetical protein